MPQREPEPTLSLWNGASRLLGQDIAEKAFDRASPVLQLQWPERDAWAQQELARVMQYDGAFSPYCPSASLSDYASQEEIATAIAALKTQYRELGRALREANLAAGSDLQQPGESRYGHYQRYKLLDEERQQTLSRISQLQYDRKKINSALKEMAEHRVPQEFDGSSCAEVAAIRERYTAAYRAALDVWHNETRERVTGEAAWAAELQRRRQIAADSRRDTENLIRRCAHRDRQPGPRVGDFLKVAGAQRRITTIFRDGVSAVDIGKYNPSFYLADDRVSFSGARGDSFALNDIAATGEVRDGTFWFFHNDTTAAGGGITFAVPCRVFEWAECLADNEAA